MTGPVFLSSQYLSSSRCASVRGSRRSSCNSKVIGKSTYFSAAGTAPNSPQRSPLSGTCRERNIYARTSSPSSRSYSSSNKLTPLSFAQQKLSSVEAKVYSTSTTVMGSLYGLSLAAGGAYLTVTAANLWNPFGWALAASGVFVFGVYLIKRHHDNKQIKQAQINLDRKVKVARAGADGNTNKLWNDFKISIKEPFVEAYSNPTIGAESVREISVNFAKQIIPVFKRPCSKDYEREMTYLISAYFLSAPKNIDNKFSYDSFFDYLRSLNIKEDDQFVLDILRSLKNTLDDPDKIENDPSIAKEIEQSFNIIRDYIVKEVLVLSSIKCVNHQLEN